MTNPTQLFLYIAACQTALIVAAIMPAMISATVHS